MPDKGKKIYVYCKTGARAALATKLLNEVGYTNAVAANTGGVAWVKAGYPVKTSITDEELLPHPKSEQTGLNATAPAAHLGGGIAFLGLELILC